MHLRRGVSALCLMLLQQSLLVLRLLLRHVDQPRVHFLVTLLLVAEDELFLSVEKPLSGLTLA